MTRDKRGSLCRRLELWDAVLMAVRAADPVNIVGALRIGEGGVHLLHIDAAVGHLRVARFARPGGILAVSIVAGEAADSFVNAHGRAVIA